MIFYWIAVFVVNIIFRIYFKVETVGKENIPENGNLILISNHVYLVDPIILAITNPKVLRFMAKEELFKNPLFGLLLKHIGVFAVKRGTGDGGSLKKALDILENDGVLGIFPEGTRSYGGETGTPKAGAAYLAAHAGADILPACITYSNGTKFRSVVTVRYGKVVKKEEFADQPANKSGLKAITEITFGAVKNLLAEGE